MHKTGATRFLLFFLLVLYKPALAAEVPFTLSYHHNHTGATVQTPLNQLPFKLLPKGQHISPDANQGTYIFRLKLNGEPPRGGLVIESLDEHIELIKLYVIRNGRQALLAQAGNSVKQQVTELGMPTFTINGTDSEFYIETKFSKNVSVNFRLVTLNGYSIEGSGIWTYLKVGLYYGFAVIVVLFTAILHFVFRQKTFLYYSLFQLFAAASIFYADGLFNIAITNAFILNNTDVPLHLCMALAGSFFCRELLNGRNALVFKSSLLWLVSAAVLVAFLIHIITGNYYAFVMAEAIVFGLMIAQWVYGIKLFKQSIINRFFVAAYGVLLAFFVNYFVLRKLGFYALESVSGALKIGNSAEMFILGLAMVYKLGMIRKAHRQYRARATEELAAANAKKAFKADEDILNQLKQRYGLTSREMDVLTGISEGLTNPEIAEKLFVSINTVKYHMRNIFVKLDVTNRAQLLNLFLGKPA